MVSVSLSLHECLEVRVSCTLPVSGGPLLLSREIGASGQDPSLTVEYDRTGDPLMLPEVCGQGTAQICQSPAQQQGSSLCLHVGSAAAPTPFLKPVAGT